MDDIFNDDVVVALDELFEDVRVEYGMILLMLIDVISYFRGGQ